MPIFTSEQWRQLGENKLVTIGKAQYGICAGCDSIVRLNKPLIGDLHICAPS
jgi:hypothetical protein